MEHAYTNSDVGFVGLVFACDGAHRRVIEMEHPCMLFARTGACYRRCSPASELRRPCFGGDWPVFGSVAGHVFIVQGMMD